MSHTCHFCYVYRHIWPQIYITGLRALGVNILSLILSRMTSFSTIVQTVITHGSCYLLYIQVQHFLVNILALNKLFHISGFILGSFGILDLRYSIKTSQELRMLSSVTINCQITKIVMNSGPQLSEL